MYIQVVSQSDFRAGVWGRGVADESEERVRWRNTSCLDFAWSPSDPSNIQQWPLLD